jgi:hypothetical protein
VMHKE